MRGDMYIHLGSWNLEEVGSPIFNILHNILHNTLPLRSPQLGMALDSWPQRMQIIATSMGVTLQARGIAF